MNSPTDTTERNPPAPAAADTTQRNPLPLVLLVALLAFIGARLGVNAPLTVLGIGLSIFFHELGHFVTARRAGMKATEFFIGVGPKLWSFRRGETEYGLKLIPVAAYVRIIGMNNLEEVDPADEPRAFRQKSYPRRLLVLSAGSLMHFALAIVLLFLVYTVTGFPDSKRWFIDDVGNNTAAQAAGVLPGDRLVAVNTTPINRWEDVSAAVTPLADQDGTLTVLRDGQQVVLPVAFGWRLSESGEAGIDGLLAGERVLAVDGQPVKTYAEFLAAVEEGKSYRMRAYGRQGDQEVEFEATVTVNKLDREGGARGYLGVGRGVHNSTTDPLTGLGRSVRQFERGVTASLKGVAAFFSPDGLGRTFTDAIRPSDESPSTAPVSDSQRLAENSRNEKRAISIIGASRAAKQTADAEGMSGFLALLAFLNVAIGVFNLLPLLPLDGGHIAVATYERIRSRRGKRYHADFAKLLPVTYAVVFFLVSLFVVTSLRDIFDPINVSR